jgi:hypothetical protein
MTVFGGVGYWWWNATVYMQEVLKDKEMELRLRRKALQMRSEEILEEAANGTRKTLPTPPAQS